MAIETLEDVMSFSTGYEFGRDGKPLTTWQASLLLNDEDYKRVAWTDIGDRASVSTVWIGVDPQFADPDRRPYLSRPRIYETLAWIDEQTFTSSRSCCTAEAMANHCKVLDRVVCHLRNIEVEPEDKPERDFAALLWQAILWDAVTPKWMK